MQNFIYRCNIFLCNKLYKYNILKSVEREDWKTLEELLAIGVNNAPIHCDFMYGTADMEVDGVKEDGTVIPVIPVMRAGEFVENCS